MLWSPSEQQGISSVVYSQCTHQGRIQDFEIGNKPNVKPIPGLGNLPLPSHPNFIYMRPRCTPKISLARCADTRFISSHSCALKFQWSYDPSNVFTINVTHKYSFLCSHFDFRATLDRMRAAQKIETTVWLACGPAGLSEAYLTACCLHFHRYGSHLFLIPLRW